MPWIPSSSESPVGLGDLEAVGDGVSTGVEPGGSHREHLGVAHLPQHAALQIVPVTGPIRDRLDAVFDRVGAVVLQHQIAFTLAEAGGLHGHRHAAPELGVEHVDAPGEEQHDRAADQEGRKGPEESAEPDPVDVRPQGTSDGGHRQRKHGQTPDLQDVGVDVEDVPRHEERREEGRDDSDGQRQRKALHLRGGLHEQEHRADDQVGQVCIENGAVHTVVALADRLAQIPGTTLELLADAFVDQHVRVHRHAHGEHHAGETGQREGPLQERHDAEDQDSVAQQREVGDDAGEEVPEQHEDHDGTDGPREGFESAVEVVGTEQGPRTLTEMGSGDSRRLQGAPPRTRVR